ncbi:MAG: hypothetical protein N4A41_14130 [Crocinitomicaceae bacterium]|jgi:hypothetical protein|nr:hypothetical protein [Crocinitomicaceae bacterium]
MKLLCFLLLFALFSCNHEPQPKTFADLSEKELSNLKAELLDSMRAEIFDRHIMVNEDTTRLGSLGCIPIEMRNVLLVRVNDLNQVMIRGEIGANISETVYEYYKANKKENDPTNNFPMYTRINREFIKAQIEQIKEEIESIKKARLKADILSFKESQLKEWETKLIVLNVIKKSELLQPHFQTAIHLQYNPKVTASKSIQDSVLLGYFRLRNDDAKLYFGKEYLELFFECRALKSALKLNAIKTTSPIQVVDFPNLKKYKIAMVVETPEPPMFLPNPTPPPSPETEKSD